MVYQRLVALALCVLCSAGVAAEQFGGEPKYKRFTSSAVMFDVPDNWNQQAAVVPPILVLFTRGNETSFSVQHRAVPFPQQFDPIFIRTETDLIPKNFPDATGLTTTTITHPSLGPMLQIDFTRPAVQGSRPIRVRQYSIPKDANVYRVVCMARADQFDRQYARMFTRMISSLAVTPPKS